MPSRKDLRELPIPDDVQELQLEIAEQGRRGDKGGGGGGGVAERRH